MSEYYTPSGYPVTLSQGASKQLRDEFVLLEEATDKLPTLSGNGSKMVAINSAGTGMEAVTGATALTNIGITATVAEINYMDGVTSNVQTQLDSIAALPGNAVVMSSVTDTTAERVVKIFNSTNTAMGFEALISTTGIQNTAVGYHSLNDNTTGIRNVAIGMNAMPVNTDGSNNVVIGYQSSANGTSIDECVIIGSSSSAGTSSTNAIAIGYGITNVTNNQAVIGNSSILNTVLRGAVQIGEYTVATLPTAGSYQAGMIMVSDEAGGYTLAYSDGTNWKRVADGATVS